MPLDPHVSRFLDMIALGTAADPSIPARREGMRALARLVAPAATAAVTTRDLVLPGPGGPLRARLYGPEAGEDPGPGLVFLHGGGLVTGDLDTHDDICRVLAEAGAMRVVAVDYRLAPEHPFPCALDDAVAATAWVARNAATLGIDPARLAVGGDSAGAGLAARVCQEALCHEACEGEGRGAPALAGQLLICPVLDIHGASASRRDFAKGYFLDDETIRRDGAACGPAASVPNPRVSPLRAPDLAGLPPAHIHTAEYDPVRDDGAAYADRLDGAGVPVTRTCHAGMIHFFYGLGRLVPRARPLLAGMARDFARDFAPAPQGAAPASFPLAPT